MNDNIDHNNPQWISSHHENLSKAIKFLLEFQNEGNQIAVLKFKIQINQDFDKLTSLNVKKLSQKFKKTSVLIFFEVNDGAKFFIYWKSKDIKQLLSLKHYKDNFLSNDKHLCEFVAETIGNFLSTGHLGINKNQNIWSNQGKIELHSIVDSRNYNLLFLASESGQVKPIDTLLKYGIESQLIGSNVTAQSLAWQGRHSDALIKLLRANLPFPTEVNVNECSEELKSFIEKCGAVHKMIEEQNMEKIKEILEDNKSLRYFYNLSNKSALKAALDLKLINIYDLLLSKNLQFGPHEDTDEIWKQFTKAEKIKLRTINLKYLKEVPEKHINILMFNTSLSHDESDEDGKKELVMRAYRALSSNPRLKIILKIVAATKIFHIIFDFFRDSTYRIDPTTGPRTRGIFYFSGRILIGAKQLLSPDTEHETFGVLAHELCHYAVLVVYENQSDPYAADDEQAKEEFARITEICREIKEEEPVIQSVFDDYPVDHQPSELIVRPPQLIALYANEPEILQEISETFEDLFQHYINIVVPAMKRALPDIEGRLVYKPTHTYNKLSNQNKLKVQSAIVSYKKVDVKLCELFPENLDIFEKLTSEHISQLLSGKILSIEDPHLRYLEELINFKWENLPENLKEKILDSNLNYQGEIIKFSNLDALVPNTFNSLTSIQITSILNGVETSVSDLGTKIETSFYIPRQFIQEDTKLIDFEYRFGCEYVDVYETRTDHVTNRTMNKTFEEFAGEFNAQSYEIRNDIFERIKQNNYFKEITVNLDRADFHIMYKNSTKLIEQAENERILVLSSEAGEGKTVTFKQVAMQIKKKLPTRWVSYIDLKDHTEFYKTSGCPENIDSVLKKILNLSTEKNNFEVRIFEESFKSGNVVLIWNGFDEISPTYNEFILNVTKDIHENSKNIQLVCTRPLYSDQLSKEFKIRNWQLIPFNEGKRDEFLRKYFKFQNLSKLEVKKMVEKVKEIIKDLNFKNLFPYRFSNPLMLRLAAEVNQGDNCLKSANIYEIFNTFVEKKIEIWFKKSEGSLKIARKLIFGRSIKILYQKYALLRQLVIFSGRTLALKQRKLKIMLKQIPSDLPLAEISGMGYLYINSKNEFEFVHRTFVDFFVAQYFIENIYELDDDVSVEEAELRLELFFHILQGYRNNQQLITDFMWAYLETKTENKNFHPIILKLLRTKFKMFFIRLLDTNELEIFKFVIEFFKKDHELLVDLLHVHQDETVFTATFNPNYFAIYVNSAYVQQLVSSCLSAEELTKFSEGKNQKGKIMLGMHLHYVLKSITINAVKNTKNGFYCLMYPKEYPYTLMQEILKVDEENNILNGKCAMLFKYGRNVLPYWQQLYKISDHLTIDEKKILFVTVLSPKIYLFYDKLFSSSDFPEYENLWNNFENLLSTSEMQEALGNALINFFEIYPCEKAGNEFFITFLLKKVEKFLTSSQIYEMFLTKNILHEAHRYSYGFMSMWNVLCKHTTENERREILIRDDFDDKNFYFYYMYSEPKTRYSSYFYRYFHYDFTTFKIFHKALTIPLADTLDFTVQIYKQHFNNEEIQEIIMSSNDFLYYAIEMVDEEPCKKFILHLEEIFKGNEKLLKKFLDRKINPMNFTIFELVEDFRGLASSLPRWFNNIKSFNDLYDKIKCY